MTVATEIVQNFISHISEKLNGTPDYSNTDQGVMVQIEIKASQNLSGKIDLSIANEDEIKKSYPHGFHILRVFDTQSFLIASGYGRPEHMYVLQFEVLAKQENEMSAEEKADEKERIKNLKAQQQVEADSLVLTSLENGIVDLIRASDDKIQAYDEMTDAKKKVIRSHLNTLLALMRL
ncbi:hypothetical protein JA13_227 [Dickeya phage vB_DsoM_JA13]|uniref:Uncharacterized protein n=1 Tax=Dickeya phage vB_DsoM_JA13 TaxID=2283030 RepID=A0A384ZWJ8_9CAUD|nr:hypothetical protein JA13_227 [Dickeya phage vB_DsoM_JA13]